MSNNPIKPQATATSAMDRLTNAGDNTFTEGMRQDAAKDNIEAAIADAGLKPATEGTRIPKSNNPVKPTDLPNDPAVDKTTQEVVGRRLTRDEQIKFLNELPEDLMAEFALRVKSHIQEDAAKIQSKAVKQKYVTDFSTMHESDVFNLDIPIQAIDHQPPEYMDVQLKDTNFVPRWIQTSAMRLGQARSQGWGYVIQEDLAKQLNIEIEEDVNGHFVYNDVVLMKCTKEKVFTQIRANFQRALSVTHQGKLHERMRNAVESEIERSSDEHGIPLRDAFNKYKESGAISTYLPLSK